MLEKVKVLEAVNGMDKEFHLDELVERLIFIQKVDEGLKAVEEGRTLTTEELRKEIRKWGK